MRSQARTSGKRGILIGLYHGSALLSTLAVFSTTWLSEAVMGLAKVLPATLKAASREAMVKKRIVMREDCTWNRSHLLCCC